MPTDHNEGVTREIAELEARLKAARARLGPDQPIGQSYQSEPSKLTQKPDNAEPVSLLATVQSHNLFLIADSALPLGSFAFSSGLESFLAHTPKHKHSSAALDRFLTLSLASYAGLTLPFVVAGRQHPEQLSAQRPAGQQRVPSAAPVERERGRERA